MTRTPKIVIYHNPRCSKSRAALELLRRHHVEPTIIEYLKTPPDRKTLRRILEMLNMTPRELMRRKEAPYKEYGLDDPSLSSTQLIDAMIKYPILIERPVVVTDDRAVLGRPPENVLEILS